MKLEMELRNIREWSWRLAILVACMAAGSSRAQDQSAKDRYHPVDLSALCASAASNSPSPQPWPALPRGAQTFGGVPFKIDGKLEVTGLDDARNGEFHPPRIGNIIIGRKAARLHLSCRRSQG